MIPEHGPTSSLPERAQRLPGPNLRRVGGALVAAVISLAMIGLTGCVSSSGPGSGGAGGRHPAPLLVVGDSNTASAWSWVADVSCADAKWAKPGLGLVNRTSMAGPALRNRIGEVMRGHRGFRVVVMLGTNDLLGPPPSVAGYRAIADGFRAEGATTVRFAVPPPVGPGHWATARMIQGWARWKAAVEATPNSVNFVYPLGGRLDRSEQHGDGIHLNAASQRRVGAAAHAQLC